MVTRVALVTGCAKRIGIGSATARALAATGITVLVTDIASQGVANEGGLSATQNNDDPTWQGLDSLVEEIKAKGGQASSTCGDVSSEADAARMVAEAMERYGRLDILVNNAGAPHGRERNDIQEVPIEAFDKVMAVNVRGPFLMSRAAVGPMRAQGWGRIINLSSLNALVPRPKRVVYSASKAAVSGMTRALALDMAAFGITVNAVCPGPVKTSRALNTATQQGGNDVEAALKKAVSYVPMGRHAAPEEIAAMITFLASDAAAYITGQCIGVNGGAVFHP